MRLKFRDFSALMNVVKYDWRDLNTITFCEPGCLVRARTCHIWGLGDLETTQTQGFAGVPKTGPDD